MVRTQIYLDDSQKERLEKLARQKHSSMAELVREAVDRYIEDAGKHPGEGLFASFGLWSDRKESGTAYAKRIRREWSR